jgi:hypothetical protein
MKVRIIRQPAGSVEGLNLGLYKPQFTYDLPGDLASYLVMTGFAKLEMRASGKGTPPGGVERRRQKQKPF